MNNKFFDKKGEENAWQKLKQEDRQDEVIMQAGWDLTNYKNNPVVLYAHNYDEFPIAKMTEIGTEPNPLLPGTFRLIGKMQFAVAENARAKTAFDLMAGGYLNAFSVGFKNNRWEVDEENIGNWIKTQLEKYLRATQQIKRR